MGLLTKQNDKAESNEVVAAKAALDKSLASYQRMQHQVSDLNARIADAQRTQQLERDAQKSDAEHYLATATMPTVKAVEVSTLYAEKRVANEALELARRAWESAGAKHNFAVRRSLLTFHQGIARDIRAKLAALVKSIENDKDFHDRDDVVQCDVSFPLEFIGHCRPADWIEQLTYRIGEIDKYLERKVGE